MEVKILCSRMIKLQFVLKFVYVFTDLKHLFDVTIHQKHLVEELIRDSMGFCKCTSKVAD